MTRAIGNIMCLLASLSIIEAAGTYYEEISGDDGKTYIEGSMQLTPVINKSFYKCSISEYCKYVIKNLTNGHFSLHNNAADLLRNMTGLRIWMKIYHGSNHSCQDAYNKGQKKTSVLPIHVPGINFINVRCDMVTGGGGWIVFQRRVDASVDFYRGWQDYKSGFGDLNGNFWLGLEKLHKLTSPGKGAILRVDIKHFTYPNTSKYAEYRDFEILSESEGYKLIIGSYSGSAGDCLSPQNNCKFTTKDRDNDKKAASNCAQENKGAWWYHACHESNLNGLYPAQGQTGASYMSWWKVSGFNGGIIFSEMKLKYSSL